MVSLIEQNRPAIKTLCRAHHVARLELFGSAARGDFDENTSDLDFFVEFEDLGWQGLSKRYFGLLHGLKDLLRKHVDLVEQGAATNPSFLEVANRHRDLIYGNPIAKAS